MVRNSVKTMVNGDIWNDPDFRQLPADAQRLYLYLWTSPLRTYCGSHDWRPGRIIAYVSNVSLDGIRKAADCLIARHFIVLDEGTEEVLVRSWARFDGLMAGRNMAVALASAWHSLASPTLREVAAHEVKRIHRDNPGFACWQVDSVKAILAAPSRSAKELPVPNDPWANPSARGSVDPSGNPSGTALSKESVDPSENPGPTSSFLLPTSKPPVVKGGVGGNDSTPKDAGRKRPAKPIPDDWQPNDSHRALATESQLDLDAEAEHFRDHAHANDRRQANWDATFRTWLRNAVKFNRGRADQPPKPPASLPDVRDLEKPPPGLSTAEYVAWAHEQKRRREEGQ